MKTLFLRPLDVWMFRDGRPFDAGSGHRAESLFPPYPSVVQGAIRTHRLLQHGINLGDKSDANKKTIADLVGNPNTFGSLLLRGPYLARWDGKTLTRYFPQPADAIADGLDLIPAQLGKPNDTLKTSSPFPQLFGLNQPTGKPKESLWVDENSLKDYLAGKPVKGVPASSLFLREDRVGIGMNEKRVVDEGMLYEAQFIRPCKDVGLLIEVGGEGYENFPENGIMQLGGESRSAWFEQVKADPLPSPKKGRHGYKAYFLTPAYFNDGWGTDWSKIFGKPDALKAAAIGRYESVGGFDRASRDNHKPAFRYVPAGSVYYFECDQEASITQLTDSDKFKQIGYGQVILKEW